MPMPMPPCPHARARAYARAQVGEIDSGPRTFQASSCAACQLPLELPAAHFHCMHSYHLACLGDNDHECLVCAPQRRRLTELQAQQRQLARGHDDFSHALERSADGFGTVSEYLGRGMLCTTIERR